MPFFISPPYFAPTTSARLFSRSKPTNASEFRPCFFQFLFTRPLHVLITVNCGLNVFSSSALGRMNMFVTKWCCHAYSVMKRTHMCDFGFAPQ